MPLAGCRQGEGYRSDGALYFTDPPFGLPKVFDDPRKELAPCTDLSGPNGLAFSPDERYLFVGNWDPAKNLLR